ncbi:alpha/beta hydrolase [Microlunatus ginsengisoli]|uniref:Alpha/beta fold hydrolase n=1 Tax=Microlunatus ginsengisoli TaxID=363863 RepID=A0ABP6ZUM0_9ACTN
MTTSSAASPNPSASPAITAGLRERLDLILARFGRDRAAQTGCPTVLPGCEPYEGGDGPLGVLVLHGFTGAPPSVRPWADRLERDGFRVSVPRLPGHGTTWQEMNQTRWEDWYGEVESSFDELASRCEHTFVCGLSMGGGLALLLAARQGRRVAGLSLVNPSVHSTIAEQAERGPVMLTMPVIRHVVPSIAAIGGDIAIPDTSEGAYDRTPLNAAWSLTQLWKVIQKELPRVEQPIRIYRSRTDHVVGPSSLAIITERTRSRDLEVVHLERSYHVATLDYDADLIFSGTSEFFARLATAAK